MAILNPPPPETPILLMDDVTSTGGSIIKTHASLSRLGSYPVAGVLSVLDREMGADETFKRLYETDLFSIFSQSEFREYFPTDN